MSDSLVKQLLIRLLPAAFLLLLGGLTTASKAVPANTAEKLAVAEKLTLPEEFTEGLPAADRLQLLQINSNRKN